MLSLQLALRLVAVGHDLRRWNEKCGVQRALLLKSQASFARLRSSSKLPELFVL